jgi:2-dehydropantoate 2-reductase
MAEAIRVLDKAGIRPARMGPLPVSSFPLLLSLPSPLFRIAARAQLKVDPEARSSMWDDLMRGRTTEIDYLNGEIVDLAKRHGIEAPINRKIVELVHEVEAKKSGSPKLAAADLWARIAS